jgi:hypothetical protein
MLLLVFRYPWARFSREFSWFEAKPGISLVWKLRRLHVKASGKLEKHQVLLCLRFETALAFSFPSKLAKQVHAGTVNFSLFFVVALLMAVHENCGTTFDLWAKNPPLSPFWPMKKSQCERKHDGAFG